MTRVEKKETEHYSNTRSNIRLVLMKQGKYDLALNQLLYQGQSMYNAVLGEGHLDLAVIRNNILLRVFLPRRERKLGHSQ